MALGNLNNLLDVVERAGAPLHRTEGDLVIAYFSGDRTVVWLNDLRRSDEALIFIALEEALGYSFAAHQATLTDALGYYLLQRIEYAMLPDEHLPPGLLHVLLRTWPFKLDEVQTHDGLLELRGRLKEVPVHFRVAPLGDAPNLNHAKSVHITPDGDLNRFAFELEDRTLHITGYIEEVIEALAYKLVF